MLRVGSGGQFEAIRLVAEGCFVVTRMVEVVNSYPPATNHQYFNNNHLMKLCGVKIVFFRLFLFFDSDVQVLKKLARYLKLERNQVKPRYLDRAHFCPIFA